MNCFVRHSLLAVTSLVALAACRTEFNPKLYPNQDQLFAVALQEYNAKHWDNAEKAFEQLTRDFPARDQRLPLSYFYLGEAQTHNGNHLLAAQSFSRIADAFPEDSLAPRAMLLGGLAYSKMWSKPDLDPEYGQRAQNTLQTFRTLYPDSPLLPSVNAELARLDDMFAQKDYTTAHHYLKRGAYDSAILYYKDVLRLHPQSPVARPAALELYDAYRAIKYTDDARDVCDAMRKSYPNDREVLSKCGSVSSAAVSTPRT